MNSSKIFFILFLVVFLSGCTSYDVVKHKTFTMDFPAWKNSEILHGDDGAISGYAASDGTCNVFMHFYTDPYLLVAQNYMRELQKSHPSVVYTYEVSDTVVSVTYEIPDVVYEKGVIKILSCYDFSYLADYICPSKILPSRTSSMQHIFDSMQC